MTTTTLSDLISQQRQRMQELRDDAQDLAQSTADDVWDRFEVEIEDAVGEELMLDTASMIGSGLASGLALAYDEGFERHVENFFKRLEKQLAETAHGNASFDSARVALSGLRKGLKLRRHAAELIGQAIERAKPGLIGMLFLARDPLSDAWDKELRDNASRVKRELLELRGKLHGTMVDETRSVILGARLAYIEMLDGLVVKIGMPQTAEMEA